MRLYPNLRIARLVDMSSLFDLNWRETRNYLLFFSSVLFRIKIRLNVDVILKHEQNNGIRNIFLTVHLKT